MITSPTERDATEALAMLNAKMLQKLNRALDRKATQRGSTPVDPTPAGDFPCLLPVPQT